MPHREAFYGSKTVEKATAVLRMVADHPEGLRNLELSQALDIDKSATHRILTSLRRAGFVRRSNDGGRFIIGDFLLEISRQYRANLLDIVEPYLKDLVSRFGETASVSALESDRFRCVSKVEAPHELRFSPDYDSSYPLNAGATGKAILASLDPKHAEAILQHSEWERYTESTVTTSEVLREEMEKIRESGIVLSIGERILGGCAVASPIFGRHGNAIGALTLSAASARMSPEALVAAGPLVRVSALGISRQLGFDPRASES